MDFGVKQRLGLLSAVWSGISSRGVTDFPSEDGFSPPLAIALCGVLVLF